MAAPKTPGASRVVPSSDPVREVVVFDGQDSCCRPLDDSRVFEALHHFFRILQRQLSTSIALRHKVLSSPSVDDVDEGHEILYRWGSGTNSVRRVRMIRYTFGIQAIT